MSSRLTSPTIELELSSEGESRVLIKLRSRVQVPKFQPKALMKIETEVRDQYYLLRTYKSNRTGLLQRSTHLILAVYKLDRGNSG